MTVEAIERAVVAWPFGDLRLEQYRYPPGPGGYVPPHTHDDYQLCLSLDFPGEYRYRRASHAVPVGSISVIHPGEVHSAHDVSDRLTATTFQVMYAKPALFAGVAADISGRPVCLPFFATPVLLDSALATSFRGFHEASAGGISRLELDARLMTVLTRLLSHAGSPSAMHTFASDHRAVQLVRDYLSDHFADDVSLAQLARLADLSPFHLTRIFSRTVGLPPHAFQLAVRIERAKEMLLAEDPVARVAVAAGFVDQSHFTRHFKRHLGVSPGRYALRKNVQDGKR
ncbi:MAG: helix-turn-helix transcriptional regulator [Chloroflexia bacterium]|nr:helix-turn-helix transcriptional regulator [Chloroflexia bacterium]